jgi:hypothetical protein
MVCKKQYEHINTYACSWRKNNAQIYLWYSVTLNLQYLLIVNALCTNHGPELHTQLKATGLNPFGHLNTMNILCNVAF